MIHQNLTEPATLEEIDFFAQLSLSVIRTATDVSRLMVDQKDPLLSLYRVGIATAIETIDPYLLFALRMPIVGSNQLIERMGMLPIDIDHDEKGVPFTDAADLELIFGDMKINWPQELMPFQDATGEAISIKPYERGRYLTCDVWHGDPGVRKVVYSSGSVNHTNDDVIGLTIRNHREGCDIIIPSDLTNGDVRLSNEIIKKITGLYAQVMDEMKDASIVSNCIPWMY